jgi:hypothetical protein
VSKLVRFHDGGEKPFLLRFSPELKVYRYEPDGFVDVTMACDLEDVCGPKISYNYKKPEPITVEAVVDFNRQIGKIPDGGKILGVDDRWLTGIIAANLAKIEAAKVKPYSPFSDKIDLIAMRYLVDSPMGWLMQHLG